MSGLIWFGTQDYQSASQARHDCDQRDGLDTYTWLAHDPREGGVQLIKDGKNNVEITIEYLKVNGGDRGGSWAARIKGRPMFTDRPMRTSFIPYFGLEGLGSLELDNEEDEYGFEGQVVFTGETPDLGTFKIRIVDDESNKAVMDGSAIEDYEEKLGKTPFLGIRVQSEQMWTAKSLIISSLMTAAQNILKPYQQSEIPLPDPSFLFQLPNEVHSMSNLFAIQKTYDGKFQFDIFFESSSIHQNLDGKLLDSAMPAFIEAHDNRFRSTFPIPSNISSSEIVFSKAITSNLLGGIGYFYGNSLVDQKSEFDWDDEEDDEDSDSVQKRAVQVAPPRELLTATPSRSFFPRGFYCIEILRDWVNLIDEDGWVGREQILGDEARSRVPAEFITQHTTYANPPTLTMAITSMISRIRSSSSVNDPLANFGVPDAQVPLGFRENGNLPHQPSLNEVTDFLKSIYSPLKRHYEWFRRTQRGRIKQYGRNARSRVEAYRWRGRSETHVLTSGMDDYPRGPAHVGELHLDLISWMAFFSRTMKEIAGFIGEEEDEARFSSIENAILQNIDDESYHVCNKGYLSLFPLMLGLLSPDSPHVEAILDMLSSPDHLWSNYGIRSLSAAHPSFGKDENYWRGPIWIPMNYMVLRSLHTIYNVQPGPYQQQSRDIYTQLRANIIQNVFKEYERTGYVWEQYDAITGEGKRSHPFTGWTSLVTLTISPELYVLPNIEVSSSIDIDETLLDDKPSSCEVDISSCETTSNLQYHGLGIHSLSFDWERDVPDGLPDSLVRYDSSDNVVSGTLPGLTELLLDFKNDDVHLKRTYQSTFLCSYKSFGVTSLRLLQLLLYQFGKKLHSSKDVKEEIYLYYSLGDIIEIWLDSNMHEYDVSELPFLQRMMEVTSFLQLRMKSHRFEKLEHALNQHYEYLTTPINSLPPSILGELSLTSVEVPPKVLSETLTILFAKSYQRIKQRHYMDYIVLSNNRDNPVTTFLGDCKKTEYWVKKAILRPHSHIERTINLEYFLTVVQGCRRLGNFACACAMINGILHFIKLKRTFGNLSRKMQQVFAEEEEFLSEGSYRALRERFHNCIPCLEIEIHVRDMKKAFEGTGHSQLRERPGFLNFERCHDVYECISTLPILSLSLNNSSDNLRDKRAVELVVAQLDNITVDDNLAEWIYRRSEIVQKDELADYQARRHELQSVGFQPAFTGITPQNMDKDMAISPHVRAPGHNPFDRQSPLCLDGQITDISSRPVDGGGNADIYTGIFRGQTVAIKSLRPWSSNSTISETKLLNRLRREYMTWTWVSHPLVLPCLGYYFLDPTRELPALISPWMTKGSFEKYAATIRGPECLKVLVEVAEGLCYLHEYIQPIVHGDIRAGNILMSDDGRPCLSDFGLSSVLRQEGLTATTEHAGSLAWMSPELLQAQAIPAIPTTYSDVWAYAMTVLEVMTGRRPYSPIEAPATLIENISHGELPPRPQRMKVPEQMSNKIWSLCQRCWRVTPRDRLTMSQVYSIIRTFLH
ncbi:hypothetical protein Clacol_006720 [Clathrus columnatus]|uniref:Mannosyl-oligosaccharide glucosidase n=1 Tax=Clathrus columnatus TaxID=1419009 RepID=A0AAV5AIG1_9AGAM|nr:hypothetical protein Clacol_006720 [Clathrus columnatus]